MNVLAVILLVLSVALWFCHCEYDGLFGVYYPTSAVRQASFPFFVLIPLLIGAALSFNAGISCVLVNSFALSSLSIESLAMILLASFITLGILKFFAINGSIILALSGALAAFLISTASTFPRSGFMMSFLAAPLLSFLLSFLFTRIQKAIFTRLKMHLITQSYYMRNAVVLGVILISMSLGLNWGGFVLGFVEVLNSGYAMCVISVLIISSLMLLKIRKRRNSEEEASGNYADFSIYAVISVGYSVAVTLILFSFTKTTSFIGLSPASLPVASLIAAAIFGFELAHKTEVVDRSLYHKEILSFIIVPTGAFLLTWLFLYIVRVDDQNLMNDFVVMVTAVIILLALLFAGYVRRQTRQHEIKDKLVYAQQQQIYEHSRALNDMELKVVLSENQALHNAVEMKKQEVMNVALSIVEQREYLESLNEIVNALSKTDDVKDKDKLIAELSSSLKQRLSHDREVDAQYFHAQAESLHEDFNAKLSENFPDLTQQERRLATMLRLGFSSKYIATLMNITPKSVEISRYRLRQKLGLSKGDNLVNFIKSI
jgi:DNA-binding NarL/FixJ family response regulator